MSDQLRYLKENGEIFFFLNSNEGQANSKTPTF